MDHEAIRPLYEKILKDNLNSGILLDNEDAVILEVIKQFGCKKALYPPHKAAFKSRKKAYEDRARRMVKFAERFYGIVDSKDKNLGPVIVAREFLNQHPDALLKLFFVNAENKWEEIDAIKEVENTWKQLLPSKQKT